MSQNTSSAVMQQRREPDDSLDFFPTPLWATRALMEKVLYRQQTGALTVLEPACGEGHMARALSEYFGKVIASDVHDYGYGAVDDFLFHSTHDVDWIITNPPFRLAEQFISKAQSLAKVGVAMLVRSAFLEGIGRYENIFSVKPPSIIAQFSERVPMFKGRVDAGGSTATSYCWLVWLKSMPVFLPKCSSFTWIPPCRKELTREGDYA